MNDNNEVLARNLKQNEIVTNRLVAFVSLSFVLILIFNELSLNFIYSEGLSISNRFIIIPCCILDCIFIAIAFYYRFDRTWLKYLLVFGVVIIYNASFFLFTTYASYFLLIPIIISSRYFDKKLTMFVVIVTILLFSLSCLFNVILDDNSQFIALLHKVSSYDTWDNPLDAFIYIFVPITLTLICVGYFCINATSKGIDLIKNQSEEFTKNSLYENELRYAGKIQSGTLPKDSFTTPDGNFEIFAGQIAAKEVCGDCYDYFMLNSYTLCFIVADVADKGLSAAMFMMSTKKAVQCALYCSNSLEEAIKLTNKLVCSDNPNGMFVTFWLGIIDTRSGIGQFVNAGHLPPLIKHSDGTVDTITNEPDLFIGNFPDLPPKVNKLEIDKGDVILLYTDGITDARNKDGQDFSNKKVFEVLANCNNDAKNVRDSIVKTVTEFSGNASQFDDMTLMAIKCNYIESKRKMSIQAETDASGTRNIINTVDELLQSIYCPDESRRNIEIVIDEICTNISEYAYENEGIIYLEITFTSNYIELVFRDDGIPFNPLVINTQENDDVLKVGGWGIYLSKNLSNEMQYRYINNQNELTIKFLWNILNNT